MTTPVATPAVKAVQSTWTVLVYLAGDNNLTEEMVWGLQELKRTAPQLHGVNAVAHFDPRGSRGRRYDLVPPSSINRPPAAAAADGNLDRYEAMVNTPAVVAARAQGPVPLRRASDFGAPPRSNQLAAFLKEQVGKLPRATQYFLVLSGHGSGALGDFLTDLDPATSLSIPDLARILREGRRRYAEAYKEFEKDERTNKDVPRKLDILGMDSCLMSNAEVCYEIRDEARFLVASEGWVDNTGWPYERVLQACLDPATKEPDPDARRVAERVASSYALFYQDYEISGLSTDIAVCDLGAFRASGEGSLIDRLRALSSTCIPSLEAEYVRDVLATPAITDEEARALQKTLISEIAGLLAPDDKERDALSVALGDGSAKAREALRELTGYPVASTSQESALLGLVQSVTGRYGVAEASPGDELAEGEKEQLRKELAQPSSRHIALALVNLLRELDPGVLHALELIEQQEAEGKSEAKEARSSLQKLHQVRWRLELQDLTKKLDPAGDELLLRNAVVAARWHAQSFKGGVYVDLIDFCGCLEKRLAQGAVKERCQEVQQMGEVAVLRSLYTGTDFQHAHGLSVYFPAQAEDFLPEYENLQFAQATGWGRFVRAYLQVTRRQRRDEATHWAEAAANVLRFGDLEIDPLDSDGIEARIVGVTGPSPKGKGAPVGKRTGTATKIRTGTATKIRTGTATKIRGEGFLAVWGNPPDGFFRQPQDGG